MVTVKYSETYDLSTKIDKMSIIGVHTPTTASIKSLWSGLWSSHKFVRVVGCDVVVACASMLPADPLQIGTEAGSIAPQDMFNPILYKAVSNDSFNTLQNRIYDRTNATAPVGSLSVTGTTIPDDSATMNDWQVYYALLADDDGWRKAMPQNGLEMRGLYPIVYTVVNNFGNMNQFRVAGNTVEEEMTEVPVADWTGITSNGKANMSFMTTGVTFKGPSMRMPKIPTKVVDPDLTIETGTNTMWTNLVKDNNIPTTYVACIVTPPGKLNKFYYRMRVTWHIEFSEVMPVTEAGAIAQIQGVYNNTYGTDYVEQSKRMTKTENTVDVDNADLELVMVSGK